MWRRRFGADPSVVGRTVVMNDREYRVIGVMPPSFEPLDAARFYNASAEIWAPIGYDRTAIDACRGCRHLRAFGRLKAGVGIADATSRDEHHPRADAPRVPDEYEAGSIAVVPLQDAITGEVRRRCWSCWRLSGSCC